MRCSGFKGFRATECSGNSQEWPYGGIWACQRIYRINQKPKPKEDLLHLGWSPPWHITLSYFVILSGLLSVIYSDILSVIWYSMWIYVTSCTSNWGPAVPTEIWYSQLRSGSAQGEEMRRIRRKQQKKKKKKKKIFDWTSFFFIFHPLELRFSGTALPIVGNPLVNHPQNHHKWVRDCIIPMTFVHDIEFFNLAKLISASLVMSLKQCGKPKNYPPKKQQPFRGHFT